LADGSRVTVTAPEGPTERRAGDERRRGPPSGPPGERSGQREGQPDGARRQRRNQGE
jgi:hypothetical protein